MKKIVIFLLALSFLSVDAQAKKKTTKKKSAKAKTTKKATAKPVEPAAVAQNVATTTPVVTENLEENDEPINSLNILNAKSPSTYRKYRDMLKVKVGDSLVSVKNKPIDYGFIEDKDVLRSMVVWEIIDMNEKINQPFTVVLQTHRLRTSIFTEIGRFELRLSESSGN